MQIYASYEGICVEFERKNNTKLVFLLLNYSQVLKVFHDWRIKILFSKILVYDHWAIGSCSVVYIFHKGIIYWVLGGYDIQMNMYLFDFEWKSIFNIW